MNKGGRFENGWLFQKIASNEYQDTIITALTFLQRPSACVDNCNCTTCVGWHFCFCRCFDDSTNTAGCCKNRIQPLVNRPTRVTEKMHNTTKYNDYRIIASKTHLPPVFEK